LLAAAALVLAHRRAEGLHHAIQRRAGLLELLPALQAAFLQALGAPFLQAALIAFGTAHRQTFLAAFLEAAFLAFLIAFGQGALQRRRIEILLAFTANHAAMAGREAVDAPASGVASNHSYRHGPACHSTVCSRNS